MTELAIKKYNNKRDKGLGFAQELINQEKDKEKKSSKKLKFLGEFLWTKNDKIFHIFFKNNESQNSEID